MNDELKSINFYENEAATYDKDRWNTRSGQYVDKVQKEVVLSLLGDLREKKVIDIATGTGRFALLVALNGAQVTVVDSSESMLDLTIERFQKAGLIKSLSVIKNKANQIEVPNNKFDICLCINGLNHIPTYSGVLAEISRIMKNNGISVTNYTNILSYYLPFGVWINMKNKSLARDVYTKWFTLLEIRNLHKANNLKIEKFKGVVHIPKGFGEGFSFNIFKAIDKASRNTFLKNIAPQIFVKAFKAET